MGAGDERNLLQQPHRLPSLQQTHHIDDAEEDVDMRNPTPELEEDIVESSPTTPMHLTSTMNLSPGCKQDRHPLPSRQYCEMQQLVV
ncbi:hypothetical protein VPH35_120733 [Triticum aestivum]